MGKKGRDSRARRSSSEARPRSRTEHDDATDPSLPFGCMSREEGPASTFGIVCGSSRRRKKEDSHQAKTSIPTEHDMRSRSRSCASLASIREGRERATNMTMMTAAALGIYSHATINEDSGSKTEWYRVDRRRSTGRRIALKADRFWIYGSDSNVRLMHNSS